MQKRTKEYVPAHKSNMQQTVRQSNMAEMDKHMEAASEKVACMFATRGSDHRVLSEIVTEWKVLFGRKANKGFFKEEATA